VTIPRRKGAPTPLSPGGAGHPLRNQERNAGHCPCASARGAGGGAYLFLTSGCAGRKLYLDREAVLRMYKMRTNTRMDAPANVYSESSRGDPSWRSRGDNS
jgi:hypothetical protein